jgi:hypothetical protein
MVSVASAVDMDIMAACLQAVRFSSSPRRSSRHHFEIEKSVKVDKRYQFTNELAVSFAV